MKATQDGISCSRAELTALLATASMDSADKNKWGVLFLTEGDSVFARATNGNAFLELKGKSERKTKHKEWMVCRKYLVDAQKQLEQKQVALLKFDGAALHQAAIMENDKELGAYSVKDDATIRQVSFPWENDNVAIPDPERRIAPRAMASAPYLKLIMLAAKAVGIEDFALHAPEAAEGAIVFSIGEDKETSAVGCIKPLPAKQQETNGGGDGAPELDDEDDDEAAN